jgi:NAD(P) transhydrogenase subunit beta
MTAMPQLVALFNGVGGGAAALVAIVEYLKLGEKATTAEVIATVFTVLIGCTSFSGSIVTFLKLQELMTTRPVVFPGGRFIIAATLAGTLVSAGWVVNSLGTTPLLVLAGLSLLFGVLFVLPVGGADVPIVISLLNAFTGLTVAAGGYVLDATLLIIAGTLVGASGTILTRLMAEAMGRSLFGTLFGAFTAKPQDSTGAAETRPVKSGTPDDVAILLNYARRVVIVPGFGLAVAQAQHTVRELADLLTSKGIDVAYGIHPVAGRMPGHMNVLLAEANVPYEQLSEMEEVNPTFPQTDVALIIGANDVVNPAAKTTPGCPIYGMPILDVAQAGNVIFLKRSMRPGFAGIENELLFDSKTTLLFGDAKASLTKVVSALKAL